jgi:hypothetical protein
MHVRTVRPDDASGVRLSTGQLAEASFALLGVLAGGAGVLESLLDALDEPEESEEPVEVLDPEQEPDSARLSVR